MGRLTDDDKHFGPITYGRAAWRCLRLVWSSGGGEGEEPHNTLTTYAFGWVARVNLPTVLLPYKIKHVAAHWDAATIERLGRDWYFEVFPREYGLSLSDGFLNVFFGAQTGDSSTTQAWGKHLPWTQWRHIRFSLYTPSGKHFYTRYESDRKKGIHGFDEQIEKTKACPSVSFRFDDFDGQRITVACHVEEREWRFGTGWFKWLSIFRRPKISRSLSLNFSSEVGPEKGSWKGGVCGHGIEMLPGESCEDAFKRYCAKEHRSKSGPFRLTFVG